LVLVAVGVKIGVYIEHALLMILVYQTFKKAEVARVVYENNNPLHGVRRYPVSPM
jgi:hypothetical protein